MRYYAAKNFCDFEPWGEAEETWNIINKANKLLELEELLEEHFKGEIPTETDINDLLWFESEWILETLEISNNSNDEFDDLDEDEEYEDFN